MVSTTSICGLMPNSHKKSLVVSNCATTWLLTFPSVLISLVFSCWKWSNFFMRHIVRENCNIFRVHIWFHAQLAQKYWMVSIAHKMRWTNQLVTLENQGPTVFWRLNHGSTWEFLSVCHKALLEPCYWPVYLKVKIFTIGALYTPQRLG